MGLWNGIADGGGTCFNGRRKLKLREMQLLILGAGLKWEGVDRWVWKKDHTGIYSVQSAYSWIRSSDFIGVEDFNKMLWSCGAPLKVKAFIWKLAQDRIPTTQNLARRNVVMQNAVCKGPV